MSLISIDAQSASLIGQTVGAIAQAAGAGPVPSLLLQTGVALAARLMDAGYECPDLETLRAKQQEVADAKPLCNTEGQVQE